MTDNYRMVDNSEQMYRCSKCGHMFESENKKYSICPVCGNACSIDSCRLVDGSNEDY